MFVIGDDRVIRYTGADDDTGDVVDAQTIERGLAWRLELGILPCFILPLYWILEIVILLLLLFS